jgi:hypothetical protein
MDWFKGKFTGKPHISWENIWFPVDFPLNQSIDDILSISANLIIRVSIHILNYTTKMDSIVEEHMNPKIV